MYSQRKKKFGHVEDPFQKYKLEVRFRKLLWNEGLRYRILTTKSLEPDIAFQQESCCFVDSLVGTLRLENLQKRLKSKYWKKKIRIISIVKKSQSRIKKNGMEVIRYGKTK